MSTKVMTDEVVASVMNLISDGRKVPEEELKTSYQEFVII